jgi:ATP-dependent DNA helicase DinG
VNPPDVLATLDVVVDALATGGETRPGQREMADAVHSAIRTGRHLAVEAGTGTGKSLAYLVPAILSGHRVLVATATKALQDQLAGKDLPFLASQLAEIREEPLRFAVLKGRSNYLCRQRVSEIAGDGTQLVLDDLAGDADGDEIARLIAWGDTSESGDRATLGVEPDHGAWSALSVSAQECPGRHRCPSGGVCFAEKARDAADAADIVVVNTHLLGVHIASGGVVLPDTDVVIVDEAHQLADIVSATTGVDLSAGRLAGLGRLVSSVIDDPGRIEDLNAAGGRLRDELEPLIGKRTPGDGPRDLLEALGVARTRVEGAIEALRRVPDGVSVDVEAKKRRAMSAATALAGELALALARPDDHVSFVESGPGSSPRLRLAPLDVGDLLGDTLFSTATTILTSATLPAGLPATLGLGPDDHDHLRVTSPFDYAEQGMLYCAAHLPDPRSPDHSEALNTELEELILAAGGRTLALFTSWRRMDEAAEHLDGRLPWPVLTQRDLPKMALVEAFRSDPHTSLLATMGFWQGIDVPGDTLTLVTIDRIPFPRPDDPLLSARREVAGAAAFKTIDLQRASILLAQAAGRLIRRRDDRGVVAVLDKRLATAKSYRWTLIDALPPFRRTAERDEVLAFLRHLRDD